MDTPRTNGKEMSDGGEKKKKRRVASVGIRTRHGRERGQMHCGWSSRPQPPLPAPLWGGLLRGGRTHDGVQETRSSSGLLPGSMLIVGD